ncbi:MAG: hypothetical protein DLM64_04090 [Solirubrobacterales bacterium]|nr:MAG: hypothetical protein DLM64_04090 [Solirubrobacterales bacterium]
MITPKHLAAMLGFAFVAAWIGLGFGDAILCLLGAAIFYAAVSFLEGDLDLADLQARFGASGASPQPPAPPAPPPRPPPRPRVR